MRNHCVLSRKLSLEIELRLWKQIALIPKLKHLKKRYRMKGIRKMVGKNIKEVMQKITSNYKNTNVGIKRVYDDE